MMKNSQKKTKIIVITGPTASGKTSLAINLAKIIKTDIICADSRIIYKGFDIVSAKPALSEREGVIHHLIDIKNPDEDFSAGDFVSLSKEIISNTDKPLIVQGGTWFYIKSLLDDYEMINSSKDEKLREELKQYSNEEIHKKLQMLDPKRADLIHPNNRDKAIRAIEVCVQLNKPMSEIKRKKNIKYDSIWFMPDIERELLYERINKRVDIMLDMGLYEEFQTVSSFYPDNKIIKNTIGYQEFLEFDYNTAVDKIKQHTRNFAKRQLSYFNSRKDIHKIKSLDDLFTIYNGAEP